MILLSVNNHDIQGTFVLSLSKSPQGFCGGYAKSFVFFTCVLFFLFLFSVFVTWLANCISCILLKKVPFAFDDDYVGGETGRAK